MVTGTGAQWPRQSSSHHTYWTSTHPAIPWQAVHGADSLPLLKKSVTSMAPELFDLTVSCQFSESLMDTNHLYYWASN